MFLCEKDNTPIKVSKANWEDIIGLLLFLITFSIPYKLDYMFIYDSMIILDSVFMITVIVRFIIKAKKRDILPQFVEEQK